MDVQKRTVARRICLGVILLLALVLRLKGIHNPLIDHPAWRQGDTASIAKNFATLRYNILYPQTNYDGPPPNYVELELQIVPIIAATIYKIAGVHEIAGRLTSIAFSLGTVAVLGLFARWLFASEIAGLFGALLLAIMPGSLFYGRTFTPDTTMVFFLTCALYVISRMLIDEETWSSAYDNRRNRTPRTRISGKTRFRRRPGAAWGAHHRTRALGTHAALGTNRC